MLGTIVNFLAIILGSIIGLIMKKGIKEKISDTIMSGLALCVIFIGISSTSKVNNMLLVIFSMVIGAGVGESIDIDRLLKKLGENIETKFKNRNLKISEGFVTASLVFCVGSMAIIGALEGGLQGKHDILFAKSVLDGIASIIFTSSLGIGVMLSSVAVLLYQGSITLMASLLKGLLVQTVITDMTVIGGLLIMGLGLNMLRITKIKVANLLPAIFVPIFYQLIMNLFF